MYASLHRTTTPSAFATTPLPAKGTCLRRKFLHSQKLDPALPRDDGSLEFSKKRGAFAPRTRHRFAVPWRA